MKALKRLGWLLAVTAVLAAPALKKPKVGFLLPEKYNSPDGMSLGPDGCIYLSMNNVVKQSFPAKLLRITKDDKLEEVCDLPPAPDSKLASPLGNVWGSDGHIYVADNQMFCGKERGKSRLLRVGMKEGKATGCAVVATGFNMANGIAAFGDSIYLCDTTLNEATPMASGVYRFKIKELDSAKPLAVTGLNDPHLLVKLLTQNKDHAVGANGLDVDKKGNLYVCNFGDAEVIKVTLTKAGAVKSQKVLAKGKGMLSCDGLHVDPAGNCWVADFLGNAVFKIGTRGGVTCIAKNGETDGANGGLHSPSEAFVRGKKLYVSNINLAYGPHKASGIYTISVIDL